MITWYFKRRTKKSCSSKTWVVFHWPTVHVFPPQNIWKKKNTMCWQTNRAMTCFKLKGKTSFIKVGFAQSTNLSTVFRPRQLEAVPFGSQDNNNQRKCIKCVNFFFFFFFPPARHLFQRTSLFSTLRGIEDSFICVTPSFIIGSLEIQRWGEKTKQLQACCVSIEGMVTDFDPLFDLHRSASPSWH